VPDLAVIVPTRGRPENIRKVIGAWDFTNAWDHADLIVVADADDPEIGTYRSIWAEDDALPAVLRVMPDWLPMVEKLDHVAVEKAASYWAVGFAGDDHLPQTIGWAKRYLDVLRELGTGMVYGDDGYQGKKLSTEWAVTSDVVRTLGRMVPADVEHMYCDNAMMDLFGRAGAMRHLPEVRIEHMHPVAGKATTDAQYQRVNHRDQFAKDRRAYEGWKARMMAPDVATVRHLRKGRPDVTEPNPTPRVARTMGSGRRPIQRSGPSATRGPRQLRVPRHFRNVRAATPEDVMVALADLASQVPADQEIVELGVFQGRTALQLAWGAAQGNGAHVTAIDPWDLPGNVYDPPFTDEESRRWAFHWVSSLGYADKIELAQAFSQDAAGRYTGRPVGLLYVDGDHTKEGARRDIEMWAVHLAPGARIAVDDYGHPDWPGVGQAVDELVAEGLLEPIELFHDRLAVTRLTDPGEMKPGEDMTEAKLAPTGTVTAITSEGVATSPYPAVSGQAAVGPASAPEKAEPVPVTVDLTEAAPGPDWTFPEDEPVAVVDAGIGEAMAAVVDAEESTDWETVTLNEALKVDDASPGEKVTDLNTTQLRQLAKARGIVLGARKDKRSEMLAALKAGE
jgi:predicted O-methyltransferase YrrM